MNDYIILKSLDLNELEKFVNNHIKQGYIPLGGITNTSDDNTHRDFLQAMVLKFRVS